MSHRTHQPGSPGVRVASFGLAGRRARPQLPTVLGLLLLAAAPSLAKGKSDQGFFSDSEGTFEADADANVYAGPAPLAVQFSARTIRASGRVTYVWSFDDHGASSSEQNPRHTFSRHGWYSVTMDARDTSGHTYRMNLLLHAWRPKDWARLQAHSDVRIMQRAARELERKRSRGATPAAGAPSGNGASADAGLRGRDSGESRRP